MKALAYITIATMVCIATNAQIVNTEFGPIQGITNGSVYQFLGIPFAKPPVEALRWKAPQTPDAWTETLSTNNFSPVCPQKQFDTGGTSSTIVGNEDCLYLNVWTPSLSPNNLPVMVFIHGGGNQQGSASEVNGGTQMFFGKNMAERGNVVVVTIQYRLGPLGFLVHPGLDAEENNGTSGNYAVLDQILALQWVKNNIGSFGGDANNVTIFGESAGGLNVGNLLTTTLANGLFHRAIIQSAVPVINQYNVSTDKGIAYVNTFTDIGTNQEKIAYMRTLPSDELVKNQTPPLSGGAVGLEWLPTIDNKAFYQTPNLSFQSGNYNKVPLIIGSNANEMSLSAPSTVYPFMVSALIKSIVPPEMEDEALAIYPPGSTTDEARLSYIAILTDAQFTSTTRRLAQCVSQNQSEPVWRYFFSYRHSLAALEPLGSYHGMELFYVFNNWENATLGQGILFKPSDKAVQDAMLDYWTNFANTGNPNASGLEDWPQYNSTTDCYINLNATPSGSQCGLRTSESNLWDAATGLSGCSGTVGVDDASINNKITISPNPTDGIMTIHLPDGDGNFSIILMDAIGRKLISLDNQRQIDLSNYRAGIYFIIAAQNGKVWTAKVIRE
jgi:para-nitrobenzyl esterase